MIELPDVYKEEINIIHYKILLFLQNDQTADNKKQISELY